MVGILPQNHCLDVLIRRILHGIVDVIHIGVNGSGAVFLNQKLPQLQIIGLLKLPF